MIRTERLTRLDGYIGELPAMGRRIEEILRLESERGALKEQIERLREAGLAGFSRISGHELGLDLVRRLAAAVVAPARRHEQIAQPL